LTTLPPDKELIGSLPNAFRKFGWALCPGIILGTGAQFLALWTGDTAYLGTGFWHLFPFTAMWMVLSFYLGLLWIVIAAVTLWVRWGQGVTNEKIQVAVMCALIITAYGAQYLAVAILLQ
jgi:hypothetical protein